MFDYKRLHNRPNKSSQFHIKLKIRKSANKVSRDSIINYYFINIHLLKFSNLNYKIVSKNKINYFKLYTDRLQIFFSGINKLLLIEIKKITIQ